MIMTMTFRNWPIQDGGSKMANPRWLIRNSAILN